MDSAVGLTQILMEGQNSDGQGTSCQQKLWTVVVTEGNKSGNCQSHYVKGFYEERDKSCATFQGDLNDRKWV